MAVSAAQRYKRVVHFPAGHPILSTGTLVQHRTLSRRAADKATFLPSSLCFLSNNVFILKLSPGVDHYISLVMRKQIVMINRDV